MSPGADLFSNVVIALTKRDKKPEFSNNSYGRQNAVKFAQVIAYSLFVIHQQGSNGKTQKKQRVS